MAWNTAGRIRVGASKGAKNVDACGSSFKSENDELFGSVWSSRKLPPKRATATAVFMRAAAWMQMLERTATPNIPQ